MTVNTKVVGWQPLNAAEKEQLETGPTYVGPLECRRMCAVLWCEREAIKWCEQRAGYYCERCYQGIVDPIRNTPRPGRNDPCPCGSGNKFKRCCL